MLRARHPIAELHRLGIIIFDPEAMTRSVLRGILYAAGARAITSVGGLEQLRDAPVNKHTAVLLVRFSIGREIASALRRGDLPLRRDLPIIAFQAAPTLLDVYSGLRLGVDEFLALPFSGRTVMSKIQTVLQNPKPIVTSGAYFGPDNSAVLKSIEQTAAASLPRGPEGIGSSLSTPLH